MSKSSKSSNKALIAVIIGLVASLAAIAALVFHYHRMLESLLCSGEEEEYDELTEMDL